MIAENRAYQSQMERKVQAQISSLTEANQQLQETNARLQRRVRELERRVPSSSAPASRHAFRNVQGEVAQALAHLEKAKVQVDDWLKEEVPDNGR